MCTFLYKACVIATDNRLDFNAILRCFKYIDIIPTSMTNNVAISTSGVVFGIYD